MILLNSAAELSDMKEKMGKNNQRLLIVSLSLSHGIARDTSWFINGWMGGWIDGEVHMLYLVIRDP